MNLSLKYVLRFCFLILIQVLVLDKIHLHHIVTPYVYLFFILWLPFSIKRGWLMAIAFLLGFTVDAFRHNPGFHAAACVFMAYLRPFVIQLLIPQDGTDHTYPEPTLKSFGGFLPYHIYTATLVTAHHAWLFMLEAWQFADLPYFLVKTFSSVLLSLFMLMITEMLFSRKQKFRTNTV